MEGFNDFVFECVVEQIPNYYTKRDASQILLLRAVISPLLQGLF